MTHHFPASVNYNNLPKADLALGQNLLISNINSPSLGRRGFRFLARDLMGLSLANC